MRYSLGLQSAASDGAVGWGILDRLLEDEAIEIDGVSGASSGSMNAILLCYGLATGGPECAREMLHRFWRSASQRSGTIAADSPAADLIFGRGNLEYLPQFWTGTAMAQISSPYIWNPFGFNLIRELLASIVDFDTLRTSSPARLFVSATDVLAGQPRVFRQEEITLEVGAASACLPLYFQAIKIDDSYFWDGGFIGAPKLQPLVEECAAEHIILVRVSPVERPDLPRMAFNITERMIELSVTAGLQEELRRINLITTLIEQGRLTPGEGVRAVHVHSIEGTQLTRKLPFSGKYNLDWKFLCDMRDFGRTLADKWLAEAPHVAAERMRAKAPEMAQ